MRIIKLACISASVFVLALCKHNKPIVLDSSFRYPDDGLTQNERYEIGLKEHYPHIKISGAVYLNDTLHKIRYEDERGDYCSIILRNIQSKDSLYINGCSFLDDYGKPVQGTYSLKYHDVLRDYRDTKIDTILSFESLSIYNLKVIISDSSKKVKYQLQKIYQSKGKWNK